MLEIGTLVDGKYKILNEIGHGGMSIVYLAMVERANQTWAIKEVRKNGSTKDDIVEQGLVAEMNILKRLNHPHLPRIIDIIDYEDSFLIVMDYIEGIDLDKKLKKGPQDWADVIEWAKQLCDVLNYLHSRKPPIIYRDMKPGNVKLKPDGQIVLFDFGTAREYKSQKAGDDTTCLGTRGYASPEQYGGMGQTDARSDIYCLGATMYHLVTGVLPGGPPDYTVAPIRSICPWLPRTGYAGSCVRGLEKIIGKCLQLNPANRYQNCTELMYDLEHVDKLSDSYVNGLKSKLRTWITIGFSAILTAALAVGLNFGATRTTENSYNDLIADAAKNISVDCAEGKDGYSKAQDELKKAIEVDPSRADAWLLLAKLYSADYVVTGLEKNDIDNLLESKEYSAGLKSNNNAFSRFSYEWGTDLFFFYSNTKPSPLNFANMGAPDKAVNFLRDTVGEEAVGKPYPGTQDELSASQKESALRLAGKFETQPAGRSTDSNLEIVNFDESTAEEAWRFAYMLYDISKGWSVEGATSVLSSGLSEHWQIIKTVADVKNYSGSTFKNQDLMKYYISNTMLRKIKEDYDRYIGYDQVSEIMNVAEKYAKNANEISNPSLKNSEIVKDIVGNIPILESWIKNKVMVGTKYE